MKIVMVHPHDIYSAQEPWTIRIIEIAKQFKKKGHEVKLIYFPLPKKERGLVNKKVKEIETIPFSRRSYHLFKNIKRFQKYAKWADIIHFQKCFANAALPALFGAYKYKKHIHYDWDDWEYEIYNFSPPSKLFGFYINTMEKIIPKLVDTMSVASHKLKELAIKRGFPKNKIIMAHVCVDLNKFNPNIKSNLRKKHNLKKNVILYLGQLHGGQYAELVIRAYPLIKNKLNDTSLLVVGGGSDLKRLKTIASSLDLDDVIFTGFVSREDVPRYMNVADVAIASFEKNKITEAKSPLKIVEYMGSGKAIVASNVGEVSNMIGDAGILVEPGNAKKIADATIKILKSKKLKTKLEKQARKRAVEKFSWEVTASNILSAYKMALKRNL